jgi:hypothetical protein
MARIDPTVLVLLGNAFRRFAEVIGLKRTARDITRSTETGEYAAYLDALRGDDAPEPAT